MRSYSFEGSVILLQEINSHMIGIEQVQGALGNLIQRRKYFSCGCNFVGYSCQRFYDLGSPGLFLEEAGVFDPSCSLICKCHGGCNNCIVIGPDFIAIQGNIAGHPASSHQGDGHPATDVEGISPILEARILLRVCQYDGAACPLDKSE